MADAVSDLLQQYYGTPDSLGGNVQPRAPRPSQYDMYGEYANSPPQLAQHNAIGHLPSALNYALSTFGQPTVDAVDQGLRGRITPQQVATEFMMNGPVGPFGMARAPPLSAAALARMRAEISANPEHADTIRSSYLQQSANEAPPALAGRQGQVTPPLATSAYPNARAQRRYQMRPERPVEWNPSPDRIDELLRLRDRGASTDEMMAAMNHPNHVVDDINGGRTEAPLSGDRLVGILEQLRTFPPRPVGRNAPLTINEWLRILDRASD